MVHDGRVLQEQDISVTRLPTLAQLQL